MDPISQELKETEDFLKNRGIQTDKLVAVYTHPGEIILGEADWGSKAGENIHLTNPKRILRHQTLGPDGLSIVFLIGDLDWVVEGSATVSGSIVYYLADISPRSRLDILRLYKDFHVRQAAASANLVVPPDKPRIQSPFARGK